MKVLIAFAFSLSLTTIVLAAEAGPPPLSTPQYDPSATYRAVHIDTLDANFWPRFEATRSAWVKTLQSHATTDGRGAYFEVDHHSMISLRSFQSFGEYQALQVFRAGVAARLGPAGRENVASYDAGDVALRTPHASEIWQRDPSFDFHGSGPNLNEYSAGYGRAVYESVTNGADFEAAWKEIDKALGKADYPLTRIAFYSLLGSGREISFWLARSQSEFEAAGTPYAAAVRVLGEDKAIELFSRVRKSSTDQTVQQWTARPELWSPP